MLYIETGWIPLYKRREDHRLIQLFKIYHNKTLDYLYELLQTLLSQVNQYNTRNTNSIREIHTIRHWQISKKYLNPLRVKIPDYYNTGSRKSHILQTETRV